MAAWIALRRAHQGGVATLQGHWFDSGRLVPGYLAGALDRLTRAGLLVLGEEDPESCGVRRATVTDAGRTHYLALCQIHNPPATVTVSTLRVPDPQFPTKIPAGRRSSCSEPLPAPGGQPDPPHQSGRSSSGLRWARCLDDGRLHLLQPGTVATTIPGHAHALCGQALDPEGLTITSSAGPLCMNCVAGIVSPAGNDPDAANHDTQDLPTDRWLIGQQPPLAR